MTNKLNQQPTYLHLFLLKGLSCLFTAIVLIFSPTLATAQKGDTLPTPGALKDVSPSSQGKITTSQNTRTNRKRNREYVFTRPSRRRTSTVTSSRSYPRNYGRGYRVEVYGNGDRLLDQVRKVEPRAFRKDKVIQVGIFAERQKADDMVKKLTARGLWARMRPM